MQWVRAMYKMQQPLSPADAGVLLSGWSNGASLQSTVSLLSLLVCIYSILALLSSDRHPSILSDWQFSQDQIRRMYKGRLWQLKWDITVRMTLITWETVRMIAGSDLIQRTTWLAFQFVQFSIHHSLLWSRTGLKITVQAGKLTLQPPLRVDVDWSAVWGGLISVLNLSDPTWDASPASLSLTPNLRTSPHAYTNMFQNFHKYISQFLQICK